MDRQEKFFDAPVDFSLDGFKAELRDLFDREEITQWDIGDLLLDAERLAGITDDDWNSGKAKALRREVVRISKKQWSTLKNYKSISRKFPKEPVDGTPSLRSDTLSYGIHVLAAPFTREAQARLLRRAEKVVEGGKSWTVNDMRELIRREQKWGGLPLTPKQEKSKPKQSFRTVRILMPEKTFQFLADIPTVRGVTPQGGGSGVADVILWIVREYCNQNLKDLNADIEAFNVAYQTRQQAAAEENKRALEQMEEELANDVDNKIPSY